MNRLLSKQEICNLICDDHQCLEPENVCDEFIIAKATAPAQLAKADKEWMEWVDNLIIGCTGGIGEDAPGCIVLDMNLQQWQERKRSIGI